MFCPKTQEENLIPKLQSSKPTQAPHSSQIIRGQHEITKPEPKLKLKTRSQNVNSDYSSTHEPRTQKYSLKLEPQTTAQQSRITLQSNTQPRIGVKAYDFGLHFTNW